MADATTSDQRLDSVRLPVPTQDGATSLRPAHSLPPWFLNRSMDIAIEQLARDRDGG
jgi:hypothetical protein